MRRLRYRAEPQVRACGAEAHYTAMDGGVFQLQNLRFISHNVPAVYEVLAGQIGLHSSPALPKCG
jgi:hypothetical protein